MLKINFINNLLNLKDVFVKNIINNDDYIEIYVETKKKPHLCLMALLLLKSMTTELKKLKIFSSKTRKLTLFLKNVDMFVKTVVSVSLKI
nr:hypothetical protein [Caloramator australicus]